VSKKYSSKKCLVLKKALDKETLASVEKKHSTNKCCRVILSTFDKKLLYRVQKNTENYLTLDQESNSNSE
jgi:hypothetical protein